MTQTQSGIKATVLGIERGMVNKVPKPQAPSITEQELAAYLAERIVTCERLLAEKPFGTCEQELKGAKEECMSIARAFRLLCPLRSELAKLRK